jgi:cilia- and flagella-associated protein 65
LQGKAIPTSISFGDVQVGQSTNRVVFLYNHSKLPAHFNFMVGDAEEEGGEQGSAFHFSKTRGVIPAGLKAHVLVRFSPTSPANYYRRIFCLVEHQHPAYIDVFGTGYIPAKGPPALPLTDSQHPCVHVGTHAYTPATAHAPTSTYRPRLTPFVPPSSVRRGA